MRWFRLFSIGLVVIVSVWPARATAAAEPTGDFVSGRGTTAPFGAITGQLQFQNIVVDAHSDPSGANPGGTVSFEVAVVNSPSFVISTLNGPVTCLAVSGNDAVIGFNDVTAGFGPVMIRVIDNGTSGSPPDEFFADPIRPATDCTVVPTGTDGGPLVSGDIVVHDAVVPTSKQQCYSGGWRHLVDDTGTPFGNQGVCVAFVATHTRP